MLWIGWFGFNAGILNPQYSAIALLNTQISSAMGALTWLSVEWCIRGMPSVLGIANGALSGLVVMTPSCAHVNTTGATHVYIYASLTFCLGAFFIGIIGGISCYFGTYVKVYFNVDDSLDSFAIHAVGGVVGVFMTSFFTTHSIDAQLRDGVFYDNTHDSGFRVGKQLYAIVVVTAWSSLFTYLILKGIDVCSQGNLRVKEEVELQGLDIGLQGESVMTSKERDKKQMYQIMKSYE
jgi:Amt family ammonium transporter